MLTLVDPEPGPGSVGWLVSPNSRFFNCALRALSCKTRGITSLAMLPPWFRILASAALMSPKSLAMRSLIRLTSSVGIRRSLI